MIDNINKVVTTKNTTVTIFEIIRICSTFETTKRSISVILDWFYKMAVIEIVFALNQEDYGLEFRLFWAKSILEPKIILTFFFVV